MTQTLPPGATQYAKRPLPTVEALDTYLGRELGVIERAIRDRRLRMQRRITADLTLTAQDEVIYADATGGAITVTLPDARRFWGYEFNVKRLNAGANLVTISAAPTTIDGATTAVLIAQYDAVTIVSDGTEWWIQ